MIREVFTDALLALATLTVAISAVGVLVMPDAFARLHFVTPASVVARSWWPWRTSSRNDWTPTPG